MLFSLTSRTGQLPLYASTALRIAEENVAHIHGHTQLDSCQAALLVRETPNTKLLTKQNADIIGTNRVNRDS